MAENEFTIVLRTKNDESRKVHAEEAAAWKKRVKDANDAMKSIGENARKEVEARKATIKGITDAEGQAEKARRDAHGRYIAQNKEVVASSKEAGKAVADGAKQAGEGWSGLGGMAGNFLKTLGGIGLTSLGLNSISSVLGLIGDSFERARAQAEGAGKFASDYRETLKEIAFLKGASAPTAEIMRADIDYRKQTLQSAGDARAVQEAFLNKAGIVTDTDLTTRKISKKTRDEAMVFAGQMASRLGGDAGSFGELYGMVPSMETGKDRLTADEINRRAIQLVNIGQAGGAGASQFASAIAGASGLVTSGAYKNAGRLGAVGSAISIATPSEIGQGLDQVNRMTQGAFTNVTKGPGALMSQSDWMKEIGATPDMDTPEILDLQFKDMEKKQKDAQAKGQKFNAMIYLAERDFSSVQDKTRFAQLYGARADLFGKGGFMDMAKEMPTTGAAAAPWEEHLQSVQGQKQKADLLSDRTQLAMGAGPQEYYQRLEKTAFNIMQQKGEVVGSYEDWKGSRTLRGGMANLLRQELLAKGEDVRPRMGSDLGGGKGDPLLSLFKTGQAGSKEAADEFYRVSMKVKQLGGDPMGGNTAMSKNYEKTQEKILESLERNEKIQTGMSKKMDPAPIQVSVPGGDNGGRAR